MDTKNTTDCGDTETLARRAMTGDARAFDLLIERHRAMAVRHAGRYFRGDHDRAQDAAQDAFVEAWRDLPTLREPAAFGAWLRRIVFKHCDRRIRAPGADALTGGALEDVIGPWREPADELARKQVAGQVRRAIRGLPPGQHEVVAAFYVEGLGHAEIAARFGLPVGTVKRRLHTARRRLIRRNLFMDTEQGVLVGGEPVPAAVAGEVTRQIQPLYGRFAAAFVRRDADTMLTIYAPDYELIYQTEPAWDLARVEREMRWEVAQPWPVPRTITYAIEEVLRASPSADDVTLRARGQRTGTYWKDPFPRIDTWRRDASGEWRLHRSEC